MSWVGAAVWWGEVAVGALVLYVAYKVIAQRLGFQQPTLDDIRKWF